MTKYVMEQSICFILQVICTWGTGQCYGLTIDLLRISKKWNRTLINNINARVHKNDTLFLLGDIAHRSSVDDVNKMLAEIKGKKILIKGNHDKKYDESLFEGIYDFLEIHYEGHSISLMHYPMVEWPKTDTVAFIFTGTNITSPSITLCSASKVFYGMTWVLMQIIIVLCR